MTPKPLSAEDRKKISKMFADPFNSPLLINASLVARIVLAEQFWREAVKNSTEWRNVKLERDNMRAFCTFCNGIEQHYSTCPWLLAQEGE